MSDKAFEKVMNRIAVEAETERVREIESQRRHELFGKIRKAGVFLFGAAILGCGYYYRANLQTFVSEQLNQKPQIDGNTGTALKSIQENAAKRDKALSEITK